MLTRITLLFTIVLVIANPQRARATCPSYPIFASESGDDSWLLAALDFDDAE